MFLSSGRTGTTKTPARQHVPLAEGLAQHARHEPHPGDRALRPACRHPGGELLPLAPQQYRPTTPLNRLRGQDHPKPASLPAAAASTRLAQTGRPSPGSRPKPRLPPSMVIRLAGPRPRAARPSRSSTRDSNPAGGSLTGNSPSSSSPVTVSRQTFSWHAVQRSRCATAAARSRPVRAPSASSAVTSANPAHPNWFSSLTVCTPRRQAARNSCKPSLIRVTSAPGVSRPCRALMPQLPVTATARAASSRPRASLTLVRDAGGPPGPAGADGRADGTSRQVAGDRRQPTIRPPAP